MISFLRFAVAIPHGRVKASPLPYTPGTPRPRPAAAARRCRRPARRGRAPLGAHAAPRPPRWGLPRAPERPPGGGRLATGQAGHEGGPQPRRLPAERRRKVPHSSAARSRSGWGLNAPRKARARPAQGRLRSPRRDARKKRASHAPERGGDAPPRKIAPAGSRIPVALRGAPRGRCASRGAWGLPRWHLGRRFSHPTGFPRSPVGRSGARGRSPEQGQRPGALSERSPLRETPSATAAARRPGRPALRPQQRQQKGTANQHGPAKGTGATGRRRGGAPSTGGSRCGAGGQRARAPTQANPAALEPPPRSRPGLRAPTGRAARSHRAPAAEPPLPSGGAASPARCCAPPAAPPALRGREGARSHLLFCMVGWESSIPRGSPIAVYQQ